MNPSEQYTIMVIALCAGIYLVISGVICCACYCRPELSAQETSPQDDILTQECSLAQDNLGDDIIAI